VGEGGELRRGDKKSKGRKMENHKIEDERTAALTSNRVLARDSRESGKAAKFSRAVGEPRVPSRESLDASP
jgi:hypothetical protein